MRAKLKNMNGVELITQERQRQIEKENWSKEHDDEHTSMCLATASASYALDVAAKHADVHERWRDIFNECADRVWPFDAEWFKPTPDDPIRQLVKAGALIAAEIDKLCRVGNSIKPSDSNCNIPLVSICTCGTEEHSELKKRSDGMFYCTRCNKPY